MKNTYLIAGLLSAALLAGCSTPMEKRQQEISLKYISEGNLIGDNYRAADTLITQVRSRLSTDKPILVATVVRIDDLYASSTFGRVTSENISSRLTQAGYKVVEMKFGNSVYMKRNEGELVLTREINSIAKNYDAQAVLVGSYGIGTDSVFINIKLVQPGSNNLVVGSHDYSVQKNREIDALLERK